MRLLFLPFLVATLAHGQVPIAPGAELQLVSGGYKFTEGPAADSEGNVYFTDQPNDRILKWTASTGKVETFLQPAGRSNGLAFDSHESLIACADEKGELWQIDTQSRKYVVLLAGFDGKQLNGPNDLWPDSAGGIYFTDPFYKRDYWQGREKPDQEKQRLFYLQNGAKIPLVADDTLIQPNGIVGSPDGKLLFVADIGDNKTYQYDIISGGILKNRRLFCHMGSDGMTCDSGGNLYLTGKGVTVFNKEGKNLGQIAVAKPWTANVTFGGPDMKTLFITASDSVFSLKMAISGSR